MLLDGKTAFITGGGRGIGRAIALAFAAEGCRVAVAARTSAELQETVTALEAQGHKAAAFHCDISDPASVEAAIGAALSEFGGVDILVNNAGHACFKPFAELSLDEWRRSLDVNLTGAFLCTQAVLPNMMARRAGRIINISSVSGLKAIVDQSAYVAAKHGLNGLTKALALELKAYNIGVHAICPGGVATRLSEEAMPHRDKTQWMTPEDVAHTARYLASLGPHAAVDIIHMRRFGNEPL